MLASLVAAPWYMCNGTTRDVLQVGIRAQDLDVMTERRIQKMSVVSGGPHIEVTNFRGAEDLL